MRKVTCMLTRSYNPTVLILVALIIFAMDTYYKSRHRALTK